MRRAVRPSSFFAEACRTSMHRRPLFFAAPVFSFFLSLFVIWNFPVLLNVGQEGATDALSVGEKALLREGDLILIQGTGYTGELILLTLNEEVPLSHCGMIVFLNGEPWVVHTISPGLSGIDGVRGNPLDEFDEKSQPNSIIVVRPRWREDGATGEDRSAALRAGYYLQKQVPFDNVFDFENRDKMYCTELLYQILDDVGFWHEHAAPRLKGGVLPFDAFLDPDSFTVIINHQESYSVDGK
jgi:hypothetical protein